MPSRNETRALCSWIALLAFLLPVVSATAEQAPVEHGAAPTPAEIDAAVSALRADPNLAIDRKTRRLKWKDSGARNAPASGTIEWLAEMFEWLAGTARVLVWATIAVLVALITVAVMRQLRLVEMRPRKRPGEAPTHIRDMDIRPESLPDDIGATALALWEGAEHRAALSLLYRGLLSRLVHGYGVPIRESNTEGDCLLLAERQLAPDTAAYAGRIVRTWQRAVYGGKEVDPDEVRGLCAEFGPKLSKGLAAGFASGDVAGESS